jgi:hypothetical protein
MKQNRIGVQFELAAISEPTITHRERQFMQHLRDREWHRAIYLPDTPKLISKLGHGWIERSGIKDEVAYRITPKGLAAKIAPVRV